MPQNVLDPILKSVKKCGNRFNYNIYIDEVVKGNYVFTDSFKEFIYCVNVDSNYAYKNGRPNLKNLYKLFKDEDLREVVRACNRNLCGNTAKDVSAYFSKCYIDNSPAYIQF